MAILEYLEIMIKLDIEEDNSEILEYVLKVAYKFYPMVYEDSKVHIPGHTRSLSGSILRHKISLKSAILYPFIP